jgi:hypothetical protein
MRYTTNGFFRHMDRLQEAMVRAAMPRTDARDPRGTRQAAAAQPRREKAPAPLTFTLAEVAHA